MNVNKIRNIIADISYEQNTKRDRIKNKIEKSLKYYKSQSKKNKKLNKNFD